MYEAAPSEQELAAWGLTLADVATVLDVWEENMPAFRLFDRMSTQWRPGMNGPTGLDYNVLFHKMDRMQLPPDEYETLETDVRIMEAAALNTIRAEARAKEGR